MFDVSELRQALKKIEGITNQEWIDSLDLRKREELEFHNLHRNRDRVRSMGQNAYEKFYGNMKYYDGNNLSRAYVNNWIRKHAKDKVFLDYCCGNGVNTIEAARAGAKLAIGLDISLVSIENAKKDALTAGVEGNTYFIQADAENTRLPDCSIDTIVCRGMLHHLDLLCAFPELYRILAPGGRILAIEALNYNPIIKLYRYLTPAMRTDWEKKHILSLRDVNFAKKFFDIGEIKFWHITSIFAAYMKPMLPLLNLLDRLLTKIPLVKLMTWMFSFELTKPKNRA